MDVYKIFYLWRLLYTISLWNGRKPKCELGISVDKRDCSELELWTGECCNVKIVINLPGGTGVDIELAGSTLTASMHKHISWFWTTANYRNLDYRRLKNIQNIYIYKTVIKINLYVRPSFNCQVSPDWDSWLAWCVSHTFNEWCNHLLRV